MFSAKKAVSLTAGLLFASLPLIVLWQRQNLYDTWRLRGYVPPVDVVRLADATSMSTLGRKIFYVQRPVLQDIVAFRSSCTTGEQTIVLGCFKSREGIYVYDVQDERLKGIQEVTAAHEMLHAAYERLNSAEKKRINSLTSEAYGELQDVRIKKNVEAYRAKDPSVVPNELHSILGSEVGKLPEELELYYDKYFDDRSKIVALSEQYEAEFTSREQTIRDYDEQLKVLKSSIDSMNDSLETQGKNIDIKSTRLKELLKANDVSTYNAGIPEYQRLVQTYNSDLAMLKSKITEYNQTVEKRNAIVGEERQLFEAIDTRLPSTR